MNSKYIKLISKCNETFRRLLEKDCQTHAEQQANGNYYLNEEIGEWVGTIQTAQGQHIESIGNANRGRAMEKSIVDRIKTMLNLSKKDEIPRFLVYQGDPRGFVIYMDSSEMVEGEQVLASSLGFKRDWGGNYSIMKS